MSRDRPRYRGKVIIGRSHQPHIVFIVQSPCDSPQIKSYDEFDKITRNGIGGINEGIVNIYDILNEEYGPLEFGINIHGNKHQPPHIKYFLIFEQFMKLLQHYYDIASSQSVKQHIKATINCFKARCKEWDHFKNTKDYSSIRKDTNIYLQLFHDDSPFHSISNDYFPNYSKYDDIKFNLDRFDSIYMDDDYDTIDINCLWNRIEIVIPTTSNSNITNMKSYKAVIDRAIDILIDANNECQQFIQHIIDTQKCCICCNESKLNKIYGGQKWWELKGLISSCGQNIIVGGPVPTIKAVIMASLFRRYTPNKIKAFIKKCAECIQFSQYKVDEIKVECDEQHYQLFLDPNDPLRIINSKTIGKGGLNAIDTIIPFNRFRNDAIQNYFEQDPHSQYVANDGNTSKQTNTSFIYIEKNDSFIHSNDSDSLHQFVIPGQYEMDPYQICKKQKNNDGKTTNRYYVQTHDVSSNCNDNDKHENYMKYGYNGHQYNIYNNNNNNKHRKYPYYHLNETKNVNNNNQIFTHCNIRWTNWRSFQRHMIKEHPEDYDETKWKYPRPPKQSGGDRRSLAFRKRKRDEI